jgi:branched-chain amino acid transport system substrate-binding protein
MKRSIKILVIGAFILILTTPSFAALTSVPIGLASNFSEPSPSSSNPYGDYFRNGVGLALSDSEARLAKRGLKIDFQEFDYGNTQIRALDAAKKASASSVIGVLGYNLSSNALIAAPVHQEAKLPMLTPSASADRIGRMGAFVHSASFDDSFMGRTIAKVARDRLHAKSAAIVVAADCAYCQDLARAFEEKFRTLGGSVSVRSEVLEGDTDFSQTVAALRKADFDIVLVPNQGFNPPRVIEALLNAGIHKPYLGGDGWGDSGKYFFDLINRQGFIGFSVSHWHPDLARPRSKRFIKAFATRFGKQPNDTAVLAYDATLLMVEAILSAKTLTRQGLEDSLNAIHRFEGVTGDFRFRAGAAPAKSLVLLTADRTKKSFKLVGTISPLGKESIQ